MLKEYHHTGKLTWPDNQRVAVDADVRFPGRRGRAAAARRQMDHEEYTQCEYGPHTAIWRILRILEEESVKATFLTCGGIAERYPEAVKAIVAKGHEIAGHGYHHEVARNLTREQEDEVMRKTVDMIRSRTGRRPVGWRSCTQSPNSLELLMEHGYPLEQQFVLPRSAVPLGSPTAACWSNCRASRSATAAPTSTATTSRQSARHAADLEGHVRRVSRESKLAPTYCPFQFHPYISGRPGRAKTLRTHHPAHEKGRGRLVRDRQRDRPLDARWRVQGGARQGGTAQGCGVANNLRGKRPASLAPLAGRGRHPATEKQISAR